jgi:hypothetical protein
MQPRPSDLAGTATAAYDGSGTQRKWLNVNELRMSMTPLNWIWFLAEIRVRSSSSLHLLTHLFIRPVFCFLVWFNIWIHADIVDVGKYAKLVFSIGTTILDILIPLIGCGASSLRTAPSSSGSPLPSSSHPDTFIQKSHVQAGGQNQRSMVSRSRRREPTADSGPIGLLKLL